MERKGFPESYDRRAPARLPHRGEERRPRGARALLLAHAVRHRARRARRGAAPRRRHRRGAQRAAPPPTPNDVAVGDLFDFSIYVDAETAHIEQWFVDRFLALKRGAFANPSSFFNVFAHLDDAEAARTALGLLERHQPAQPRRERAADEAPGDASSCRRPPTTRWSGCGCASSDRIAPAFVQRSLASPSRARRLEPMCGIVGYVGPRDSQAILLAGLARLEYRGYDSAGVAVIDGDGELGHAQARRQAQGAARRPRRRTRSPTARPASATPAGPPTAARPTPTRTRTSPTTTSSPSSTTASSRTSPRSRPTCSPTASRSSARPTPRPPPSCSAASTSAAGGDLRGRVPRRRQPPRGRLHAARDARGPPGSRRRRPPQLAARDRAGRGRELPRLGCRRLRRAHPQRARDRPGPDRLDHAERRPRHRLRRATPSRSSPSRCCGMPRPPTRAAGRASWPRRSARSPRPSPTRSSAACATARS